MVCELRQIYVVTRSRSQGPRFKLAFVNTSTGHFRLVTLQEIFRRARAIYPTWSIRFDDQEFGAG
jgi:hypothetical protein